MSSARTMEQLYRLLPAFYRALDAQQGEPLEALINVIAGQVDVIDEDISRLYRNWFIETCDEWVVPYIGDLLGVKGVHPVSDSTYSLRAFVANTIAYRRRKGTATMLEQLARDITGWNARAVEFFKLLETTQYINHLRLFNHRTPDLRIVNTLELLDTPFDTVAHTADVRHISSGRGKHNIPNIGLFLWRLDAFPIKSATAYSHNNGKYSFSPLGNDTPLFNFPQTETEITHLAEEINTPSPIRRLVLRDEKGSYYDKELSIFIREDGAEIPADKIISCNLTGWIHRPPSGMVAVDPVLGRISFPAGETIGRDSVEVRYFYGFSGKIGGGGYDRDLQSIPADTATYEIGKGKPFNTVSDAITQWNAEGKKNAVLIITDSRIYRESIDIEIPAGVTVEIRASQWEYPLLKIKKTPGFTVKGEAGSRLILDGLRLCGRHLTIEDGDLGALEIRHCTLVPGLIIDKDSQPKFPAKVSLEATNGNIGLVVSIERSICGGVKLSDTHDLYIKESIIQGLKAKAIDGPNLTVEASTIMGEVSARQVELSDSIFTGVVTAVLLQEGCVRFCYIPPGSRVPRRYRCQPDLAIKKDPEAAHEWLKPVFTSEIYGNPGYAQLGRNCPVEIFEGAENGSEMGAFNYLLQPQRVANLRASLDEYLPANMEAGIFFVN